MHAEILSIGTELLMGELVDTNSSFLASELAKLGIEVRWVTKVGDDPERLSEAIERAFKRSDVTLTSGGLGPTSDDLTRETIAKVCGEEMTVQDDLLEHLKGLFANRGFPMPETNVKQATLIPSAEAIANPMGTAPGWWVEREGSVIVAMPGPPREIQRMWANEVAPRLRERNAGIAIVTRNLKTFGISEGGLDEILSPLFESENPVLGIYSKQDGIHLRAIATAATDEKARALIIPMEAEIRGIIGDDAIWGEDDETPESKAVALLGGRGLTLGVVEAFTGGLLCNNLTEVTGSEDVLKGGSVASSADALVRLGMSASIVEKHGIASAEAAVDMARAACETFGADVGIGVSPLALESANGSVVAGTSFIGYSMIGRSGSTSGHYPTRRLRIRGRAVTHALLGMIRFVRGLPLEAATLRR
jgi:nicotinamide-nucleotide amidase